VVGYVDASASAVVPPPAPTTSTPTATTPVKLPPATTAAEAARAAARAVRGNRRPLPTAPEPKGGVDGAPAPPSFRPPPAGIDAELTPGRYVFPVYGPVAF